MATDIDICNRALLSIGVQQIISALDQDSIEARACNTIYTYIRDWCLGVTNWNFARRSAALSANNQTASPPVTPWADTTSVSPPWKYAYTLPSDCLQVQYITNSDVNAADTAFLGEPKRFVVAAGTVAGTLQRVLLTNEIHIVCIYTARIADPTQWPWLFERLVVSAVAWNLSMGLSNDLKLTEYLDGIMHRYFEAAIQANLAEGLSFGDTTPEWVQALGINYPYRRYDGKATTQVPDQGRRNDNGR